MSAASSTPRGSLRALRDVGPRPMEPATASPRLTSTPDHGGFLVLNGSRPRVDQDALVDLVAAVADGSLDQVEEIAAQIERLTHHGGD